MEKLTIATIIAILFIIYKKTQKKEGSALVPAATTTINYDNSPW